MRKVLSILFSILLLLTASWPVLAGPTQQEKQSLTFGGNYERQHWTPERLYPPVTLKWVADIGQSFSQPSLKDGKITILGGNDLIQLDVKDGSILSHQGANGGAGATISSPSVRPDNSLAFGSRNGFLGIFRNGSMSGLQIGNSVSSVPVVFGQALAIGSDDKNVWILPFPDTAPENFVHYTMNATVTGSPTRLTDDSFVVGANNGKIARIKIDGTPIWERIAPGATGIPASMAVHEGKIYFSSENGYFYCYDEDGSLIWSKHHGATLINNSPAVSPSLIFFPAKNPVRLYAVDISTGELAWSAPIGGGSASAPLYWAAANIVLQGGMDGNIYGFDATTGQPVPWYKDENGQMHDHINLGGPVTGELTLADGLLLIPAGQKLYAFEASKDQINLVAVSLDPGTGQAQPSQTYTATTVFRNDGTSPVNGVDIRAIVNNQPAQFFITGGTPITSINIQPGESVTLYYQWTAPRIGSSLHRVEINRNRVPQETTYDDNYKEATVPVAALANPVGNGDELFFQAYPQQSFLNPQENPRNRPPRDPFTAKFTDHVFATLVPNKIISFVSSGNLPDYTQYIAPGPPPNTPCGSYSVLDSWEILPSGYVVYPKQHPHWTFGHPLPPDGSETVSLNVSQDSHSAETEFREYWSTANVPRYDIIDKKMVDDQGPESFVIEVHYTVRVNYTVYVYDLCGCCGKDCSPCCALCDVYTETRDYSYVKTATLVVNGTGAVPGSM